jgi:hypothetical protein
LRPRPLDGFFIYVIIQFKTFSKKEAKMIQLKGTLEIAKAKKFCAVFFELEITRRTQITVTPDQNHLDFVVTIVPEDEGVYDLLKSSLRNGLLQEFGSKFAPIVAK